MSRQLTGILGQFQMPFRATGLARSDPMNCGQPVTFKNKLRVQLSALLNGAKVTQTIWFIAKLQRVKKHVYDPFHTIA